MTTRNQPDIRNKAMTISAIMKNPKLAKTISDAFDAPAGSTKNANARKILRSLNKVNGNYSKGMNDGQGGFSDWVNQYLVNPLRNFASGSLSQPSQAQWDAQKQSASQQNLQFLKSIDIATPFAQSQQRNVDPNKYVLDASGNIIGLQPTAFGKTGLARDVTTGLNVLGGIGMNILGAGKAVAEAPGSVFPTISSVIMPGIDYLKKYTSEDPVLEQAYSNLIDFNGEIQTTEGRRFDSEKELAKYLDVPLGQVDWSKIKKTGKIPSQKAVSTVQYEKPIGPEPEGTISTAPGYTGTPIISGNTYTYTNKNGTVHTGTLGDNYIDKTTYTAPPASELPGQIPPPEGDQFGYDQYDPNDTTFNRLAFNAPEGSQAKRAQDAYLAGMGRTAFTLQELSDPMALGLRLGVPKEVAATFPKIFLQDTIDEITSSLKKEYQIDALRNDLTAKVNAGLTLEQDFTDYIKGKDEYLKKIDGLLDSTNEKIAYMDTSNPYVAARVKNYTSYLTILKGRQNKRYIDFLNMGINQWNAEMTAETNLYNSNLSAYNEALKSDVGRAKDWDKIVKDMLGEMYDSVEKMEDRAIKISAANQDIMKGNLDIALDSLKYTQLKLTGGVESTQTERDRKLAQSALLNFVPEFNDQKKIVNADAYLTQRSSFILATAMDGKLFDEMYSSWLSEEDQVKLGFKKEADTSLTINYDKLVAEYLVKTPPWTRKQIEEENKEDGKIPTGLTIALDNVFEKKKGWVGSAIESVGNVLGL